MVRLKVMAKAEHGIYRMSPDQWKWWALREVLSVESLIQYGSRYKAAVRKNHGNRVVF